MPQLFFQGVSEYELEALKLPNQHRDQCLKFAITLRKCLQDKGFQSNHAFRAGMDRDLCSLEIHHLRKCRKNISNFWYLSDIKKMKSSQPRVFEAEKVSPTLEEKVLSPTIFDTRTIL